MAREEEEAWQGCFEAVVKAPIGQVWEVTSNFMGMKGWGGSVVSSCKQVGGEHNKVGCVRRCDGMDGKLLAQERLLTMEAEDHRYSYVVEEASMAGLAGYVATFHLSSSSGEPQYTHVAWSYRVPPVPSFSPHDFQAIIFQVYGAIVSDLHNLLHK